ncbi:MAG: hypothetical protein WA702_04425 [Bradyrhizobium sp.]|jgi:hypothetical protein|uniref:hypothetical protein n=1 Tax=Bradyrhizobium sp. TaxID=376 RepID=UPI003C7A7565
MATVETSNPNVASTSGTIARLQRLHAAVRFALPQRDAILLIVALVLAVAALNAFEPLILKSVFDQLTGPEHATAIGRAPAGARVVSRPQGDDRAPGRWRRHHRRCAARTELCRTRRAARGVKRSHAAVLTVSRGRARLSMS